MTAWEQKAHDTIAAHARTAWQANKRRPRYRLPEIAAALVAALGLHCERAREHEIKRLLMVNELGAWTLV